MKSEVTTRVHLYPGCSAAIGDKGRALFAEVAAACDDDGLLAQIKILSQEERLPPWLPDLLRVERTRNLVMAEDTAITLPVAHLVINPTLQLLPVEWVGLDRLLVDRQWNSRPAEAGEVIMSWRHPVSGEVEVTQASASDLLALKILADDLSASAVALEGGVAVGVVDAAIAQAAASGIILKPPSALNRPTTFSRDLDHTVDPAFLTCEVFAVQWHITQACDLHCKHCYDRTSRGELPLAKGLAILDDIRSFCRQRGVHGQVTFSGGNPLLFPTSWHSIRRLLTDIWGWLSWVIQHQGRCSNRCQP